MGLFNYFTKGVGVDLGTANFIIYEEGRGIVVNEPSVAAVNNRTGQILAVGQEARKMVGRAPAHVNVVRPLTNGVISDFEMTQELLRHFLKRMSGQKLMMNFKRAVVGVPSNITEVERKSVEDAVTGVGVSKVYIVDEPVAAALGARLPLNEPTANMIVDIGGGTTEIAVISMGGAVTSKSLKVAGDKFTEDIIRFVRDEFKLAIGEPTAEELKINIGSAIQMDKKLEMTVRGRDLATGLPKEVIIKDSYVRAAISKSLRSIVDSVKQVIEMTPPELTGDILKRGIYLCGGGSLLLGIDKLLSKELTVATTLVDDPLTCVARGTGVLLESFEEYKDLFHRPFAPKDIKM
ncbi:MAG: rod shape-determining protein [Candidatus Harrisonbacteria bacterium RIFCSPLOWO2_02_FULL_41_13b]|uniref:Cell shape-determining protein MreB n=1 Tax=Candidatus Harrisonbacteria bacterium RIFCSPLOWO2_02_FULL_41_13b TaxID=1798409 RepID=A0A1G1ZTL7_9BACT|nr:MAG: rod shape-determining protein [Candidatus Harrisonbacteria bacterium RIFCSPHIGHO2_02_FULL_40_20]OGY67476.1 MAG: rod shape-determining protein [Candidatus Harrisonbacteria bacterium RIFCSPLOWO2_02_FULL_41_13b]